MNGSMIEFGFLAEMKLVELYGWWFPRDMTFPNCVEVKNKYDTTIDVSVSHAKWSALLGGLFNSVDTQMPKIHGVQQEVVLSHVYCWNP